MRKGVVLLVAVALLSLVFLMTGCIRYYRWESQKENPGTADVLIVLGLKLNREGKASFILHNRVAMAKYLFDEGYAPHIIMTGGKPVAGVSEAAKMAAIAMAMGVEREKISMEERATTSIENAEFSAELMVASGWRSALVVTDAAHLGYALPVFRDEFEKRGLTLHWLPVKYDLLNELGIGKRPDDPPE